MTDTATGRMVRNIYDAVERGFDEAGLPLSPAQRAFLREGIECMDPRAEAFAPRLPLVLADTG